MMKPATEQQQSTVFFMPPRESMQLNAEPAAATDFCGPATAQSDFSQDTTAFD